MQEVNSACLARATETGEIRSIQGLPLDSSVSKHQRKQTFARTAVTLQLPRRLVAACQSGHTSEKMNVAVCWQQGVVPYSRS